MQLNPRAGNIKRILRSDDSLPEQARWAHLACSELPALVPQEKVFSGGYRGRARPPLFLDQTEARGSKKFF